MEKIKKDDNLGMLEINKLLSFNFYIPSYQRGYRWTKTEVNALLEDIYEFGNQNHTPEEYYCLQPIVVKEKIIEETKYWEIIDGQQRLTTILIILYYFNQTEFRNPRDIFSIKFQTRPSSNSFLENIENEELALKNIDYFHMHQSYITIKKWFEEKTKISPTKPGSFYKTLVDAVNVIWYEIIDNENPAVIENAIDVFTRINMGKIPLTNSELVKALFLKKGNFKEHQIYTQIKIANEWDEIEKKLQNDSFWYFIYNTKNPITYENRIEYIFDLLKDKKIEHEEYHTFNKFLFDYVKIEKDQKGKHVEDTWLEIKNNFQCLEEWYNNSELYHLIGFLIEYNYDIVTLQKNKVGLSKIKFVEFLKDQISELFKDINIEDLVYKQHNPDIKKTLLLFNIITIVSTQKAEVRFPFDKYKKEKWDIEHVNSTKLK